jgi:hypothetical protein
MAGRYTVYVDDNYHYMDESERYKLGEFEDCESAIAACQRIVDEHLAHSNPDQSPEEIFDAYTGFGEDPWIASEDQACKFSAWEYARARSREISRKPG